MFEPMLRNVINNKVYIFSTEFESEGCEGCAFIDDYIGCLNTPRFCDEDETGIWVQTNLVTE